MKSILYCRWDWVCNRRLTSGAWHTNYELGQHVWHGDRHVVRLFTIGESGWV